MGKLAIAAAAVAAIVALLGTKKVAKAAKWEGKFAENTELTKAVRLFEGHIAGSESVAFHGDSMVLIDGFAHVKVARGDPGNPTSMVLNDQTVAYTGPGRPLGFHLGHDGSLLICNSMLGLTQLQLGKSQQQTVLANSVRVPKDSLGVLSAASLGDKRAARLVPAVSDRVYKAAAGVGLGSPSLPASDRDSVLSPILFADDLDETPNGDIYFTDASAVPSALNRGGRYDALAASVTTALQGSPSGRLLRYRPSTGETDVVADNLWFPNGVAAAADGSYIVFCETWTARVLKYHVTGPKAGQTETIVADLPAYPDGVSRAPDGNFWVALVTERVPIIESAFGSRLARWALAWIFHLVNVPTKTIGAVLKISPEGEILKFLMDPTGSKVGALTSAVEHKGWLFVGSLVNNFVGALDLSLV